MCDPFSLAVIGGGAAFAAKEFLVPEIPSAPQRDPAAERAEAEAKATQTANQKIAARRRRRRSQDSLLASGGVNGGTGSSQDLTNSPLSGSVVGRGAPRSRASALSGGL